MMSLKNLLSDDDMCGTRNGQQFCETLHNGKHNNVENRHTVMLHGSLQDKMKGRAFVQERIFSNTDEVLVNL